MKRIFPLLAALLLTGCHLRNYERVYTLSYTGSGGETVSGSAHLIPPKRPAK
jgi:hypothetical protein